MTSSPQKSRPVVHLFVGLHKTGSSTLRLMLDLHGRTMDRHGFHLPRATWTRYIDHRLNGGHHNVAWEICGHHPVLPQFGTIADLVAEIASLPHLEHIVFSEDLDYANGAQVKALAEALSAFDVRIVVFLRNQPDWLQSHYAEEHKWYVPEPRADWFLDRVRHDRRLHLDALCFRWARAFDGRIAVRCYEDVAARVFDTLLECCGAPAALRRELGERSVPLVNASPDANTLAILQEMSAYARSNGLRAEYFNNVISPAVVTAAAACPRSRRRVPVSAAAREELLSLMSSCNRAVADAFGLSLGSGYWTLPLEPEPVAPSQPTPPLLTEMCLDLSIRAGSRMRTLGDSSPTRTWGTLADEYYPWPLDADPSSREGTHQLLAAALSDDDGALYVERKGDVVTAFQQRNSGLNELRQLTADEWSGVLHTLHRDARLNRVSWNNVREGQMMFERCGAGIPVSVRHVPTTDGELVFVEPADRRIASVNDRGRVAPATARGAGPA